jgi:hypothetical protein
MTCSVCTTTLLFHCTTDVDSTVDAWSTSVHLGAGHFVEGVSPTSRSAIMKKVWHAPQNASIDDAGLSDDNSSDPDSGDEGDGGDFDVGDAVGKALALVNQVGST